MKEIISKLETIQCNFEVLQKEIHQHPKYIPTQYIDTGVDITAQMLQDVISYMKEQVITNEGHKNDNEIAVNINISILCNGSEETT